MGWETKIVDVMTKDALLVQTTTQVDDALYTKVLSLHAKINFAASTDARWSQIVDCMTFYFSKVEKMNLLLNTLTSWSINGIVNLS
jgi:hypothetical protein